MPASFLRRFCGWFVDWVICFFLMLPVDFIFIRPIIVVLMLPPGTDTHNVDATATWMAASALQKILAMIAIVWGGYGLPSALYYASMESSEWRATLGKRLLHLTVARVDGKAVSFFRSFVRFVIKFVVTQIPIGFLLILPILGKKQGLHDLLCDVIVSEPPSENESGQLHR